MDCRRTRLLLQAFLDQEAIAEDRDAVQEHLASCPSCRDTLASLQQLQRELAGPELFYPAAPALRAKTAALLQEATVPRRDYRPVWTALAGLAAGIALTMAASPSRRLFEGPDAVDAAATQLIDDHIRSLALNHLTDVQSNDQHNVKPWFNGKLDFAPIVENPSAEGFPLIGGRLEVFRGRRVAALVYQRRGHYINVIERPLDGTTTASTTALERQGFHLRQWSMDGLQLFAISELNPSELDQFVALLQQH